MSALFTPIALRSLTLQNRICVSPMCQYSAENGTPTDWHLAHLTTMAISGAGMLILEATAVEPEGRITEADLGLWGDAQEQGFARVLETVRKYAPTPLALQLAHAGRKGSSAVPWQGGAQIPAAQGGWVTAAPSAVPHIATEAPPAALDRAGLARIRDSFAAAARRAARLGFDALELHAAHGYLLHQFLSPLSNQRTDEYGGTLANRMRFVLEVFDAVRDAFPAEKPVGAKLSATDWVPDGWDLEQTITLAGELHARGADYIAASSGGLSAAQKIPVAPGYQLPFAQAIRAATGAKVMAVGLITEPQQAEDVIANGQADCVALARGMLYDPRWPWHAAAHLGATVQAPPQYWRSQPHGLAGLFGAAARHGQR
jgi:2,4-dienoyl-CoA reductase-like NADH-dependent reductase (Old Yellow Enzyme family)